MKNLLRLTLVVSCLGVLDTLQLAHAETPSLAHVPLCLGLSIVTAISQPQGDYESIKRIESVTPESVRVRYSSYMPEPHVDHGSTTSPAPPWVPFTVYRTVLVADLDNAGAYLQQFGIPGSVPETVSGTTALGLSRKVFREIKASKTVRMSIYQAINPAVPLNPDSSAWGGSYGLPGEIALVDPRPVSVPVLVNDRPAILPAIHARGTFLWDNADFFFLDDDANPIALRYTIGNAAHPERDQLRVIKIAYSCATPPLPAKADGGASVGAAGNGGETAGESTEAFIERALVETGRVEVFSIYFDFNRDVIREESQPTLQAIASILRKHPDWRLAVEGHTDNIGTPNFNLDLSQRRSAAVKDALATTLAIDPGRLSTSGYGASRPKDTNETLEGRARNRRVELVRSSR